MRTILTANFNSTAGAHNAHGDLIDTGYPTEMVYLDSDAGEVKVITSADSEREAREILGRHQPEAITETTG